MTSARIDAIKFKDGRFKGFAQCSMCFHHFHSRICTTQEEALDCARAGLAGHELEKHPELFPAKEQGAK